MRKAILLGASALVAFSSSGAYAQGSAAEEGGAEGEIVVTAQRRAETLQSVPLAVSAFNAEALERQQIKNSSDLQLTLPNVTFTKTSFTGSSFTIRGIGDLCVGVSCDAATGIHTDGSPLFGTRLFETEFFDLERIEVLRGPQGTLFGRNATSGVVNLITARPDLSRFRASAEAEYGNNDAAKLKGMVNLPVSDTLGLRVAGYYLERDGFTRNLFDNSRIDGRGQYAVRGSLKFEPSANTTINLMAYYFREDDDRLRIQKQLCQRDPTGVLGCLPGRLDYAAPNANSGFIGTLSSREFLRFRGGASLGAALAPLALGSLYGPDSATDSIVPTDMRTVNVDFQPEYFAEEQQYQAQIDHDFGPAQLQLTGLYARSTVDSRQDQSLLVTNRSVWQAGINNLQNYATVNPTATGAALNGLLAPMRAALIPNGAAGTLCTSLADPEGVGAYGGEGNLRGHADQF